MFRTLPIALLAIASIAPALAQGTLAVDLLDPQETSGEIPANLRIVDIYADIVSTDVWTAGGLRAVTHNGATLAYHDADANVPGVQPGLINPGIADKFLTSLSKTRPRDAASRFTNAVAAVAGAYNPTGPVPVTTESELNVAWFRSPPETGYQFDGYIARISVDVINPDIIY